MNSHGLLELLERVRRGEVSAADAARQLTHTAHTEDAAVDLNRLERCGFPEVVYGRGKTSAAIVEIFRAQIAHGQDCFATLVSPEQAQDVVAQLPDVVYNPTGRTLRLPCPGAERPTGGKVAVITAGTSDRPIAEEACETLRWMGCELDLIVDVGVAGPHRLVAQRHRFVEADAVIVIAGMEGALPSVVGGHVDCPVIAVPTSVGYGASFNGVAALLGMLNSCASNVVVVNIDSGFKGAYVAGLIARRLARARLG
ncbi:MAG TPA: nickel pincer cofactor biosynthesis protein LarB [Planctomycetaceae bacterium]|nr:nickel pincer cofactor biosynthesis protein LarB [Planctomycetaceae bacterium]